MRVICRTELFKHLIVFFLIIMVKVINTTNASVASDWWNECHLTCSQPQPRAIKLNDRSIVIHRCDAGTGCCTGTQVCHVSTREYLDIPILETENEQIENHTKCACQETSEIKRETIKQMLTNLTEQYGMELIISNETLKKIK